MFDFFRWAEQAIERHAARKERAKKDALSFEYRAGADKLAPNAHLLGKANEARVAWWLRECGGVPLYAWILLLPPGLMALGLLCS